MRKPTVLAIVMLAAGCSNKTPPTARAPLIYSPDWLQCGTKIVRLSSVSKVDVDDQGTAKVFLDGTTSGIDVNTQGTPVIENKLVTYQWLMLYPDPNAKSHTWVRSDAIVAVRDGQPLLVEGKSALLGYALDPRTDTLVRNAVRVQQQKK